MKCKIKSEINSQEPSNQYRTRFNYIFTLQEYLGSCLLYFPGVVEAGKLLFTPERLRMNSNPHSAALA